jgi:hypothetical protein
MRVDWNLMRQIVLAVENSSTAGLPDIVGRSEEEVGYHAHLLIGSGLAEGFSVRNMGHRLPFDFISDLTVAGHEFAELARNDDRWHAAITQAQGSGAVTLATLLHLLMHPPRQQVVPPNGKSGQETIQIIANKALTFLKDGYGGEQVTVKPGSRPQPVPGWVRESATFKHAARDGSVMEVEIKTPLPPPTASKSTPAAPGAFGQPGFGQQGVPSDPAALSPGREYPRWIYHATEKPKMVSSREEEVALGLEWSRVYIHQEYPKVKYHWGGKEITIQTADEEAALGGGWANTPAAFAPYKGPRTAGAEHHPERWVDEWPISGLSAEDRKRIKAQLWRADSGFWKSPDARSADTAAMRLAFDGVANVLFAAGILTEQLLRDQIPLFVWDSAIAAGWWRLASETPQDVFREQLGHYWVWREEGKDWQGLFRSETGKWRAQLLERASESPKAAPANDAPDVDAVMDTFRTIAGMKASDSENRGFWLTVEIFPSLASFVPEKLGWAVEEIVDEHEVTIRKAVIEALNVLRSPNSDQVPSTLIFDAVVEMGAELFNEALGRMDWMDDNNPPEAYDDAADALYQDAIDFVVRKYKTLAAEIPGLGPTCEPARLDTLRVEWLQIREEAKQQTHEWARKIRESRAEADRLRAGNAAAPGSEAPARKPGDKTSGEPEPAGAPSSSRPNRKETPPGSMDRVEMTDPIWDFSGTKGGPISIKRLSGQVDMIDPSTEDEPDDADLNPEEELGISEGTIGGRSGLRTEIEAAFSGSDWPPPHAIIQAFRHHAVKIFDVNAAAYRRVISEQGRDAKVALNAMSRNLLVGLFGREWENSPGERVVRIRWEDGDDGWKGQEIAVIAGNDPDPTCLYHQLVSDAIKHRYRFHAPLPPHVPGEPPGLGVSNLEWWKYIGLKERHDLAMTVRPYLEDRIAHWQVVYAAPLPKVAAQAPQAPTTNGQPVRQSAPMTAESSASATNRAEPSPDFTSEEKRNSAVAAYTESWNRCSEAALARTAMVNPADLSKWKKDRLPNGPGKRARIEKALMNNEAPTLIAKRSVVG